MAWWIWVLLAVWGPATALGILVAAVFGAALVTEAVRSRFASTVKKRETIATA